MAAITLMRTPAEAGLAQSFDELKRSLPGDTGERERAFALFAERGLPHRRVEEFKYTDLRAALREAAPFAPRPDTGEAVAATKAAPSFGEADAAALAFVNGHLVREASDLGRLPEGVEVTPLAEVLAKGHPLLASLSPVEWARQNPVYQLNSAFMADGSLVRIAAGAGVETPLHLRFINTGAEAFATATRVLIVVEEGASVTLLESHSGPDGVAYQPNGVVEIVAGDRATIHHVRLNAEGRDAVALSTLAARLGAEASISAVNVVIGSGVSRHQVYVTFAGERGKAQINGVAMLNGRQHADSTLLIDHAAPRGESRELFKAAIDGDATGVFQGKIIVQPHAQKTDGRMMSSALLLSEGGTMNNKPELEIFADDVQCGHGATCGQLDEDLLFYLMARGLPRPEAENLMVQAFLGEALEAVEHEGAREALLEMVGGWLKGRSG